jgi:hypothetical protein
MLEDRKVRLACHECDIDEFDGITESALAALIAKGEWQFIEEYQTFEESMRLNGTDETRPFVSSVFAWSTHIGLCPNCAAETGVTS